VQDVYNDRIQQDLQATVWNAGGCSSWYLDRNGRNTTLWPTFTWVFRRQVRRFDPEEYVVRTAQTSPRTEPVPA
jgi:hypothetical protein